RTMRAGAPLIVIFVVNDLALSLKKICGRQSLLSDDDLPHRLSSKFDVSARPRSLFSKSRIALKPLCAGVPSERSVRVAVIGLGYVGLPLAAGVAATGANVIGIDIDAEKVKAVNDAQSPLRGQEPGLADLAGEQVSKGRLRASLGPKEASGADAVAVCVETPIDPATHAPSYKASKAAIAGVAPLLTRGALVLIESTLAPGTMEGVVRPAL